MSLVLSLVIGASPSLFVSLQADQPGASGPAALAAPRAARMVPQPVGPRVRPAAPALSNRINAPGAGSIELDRIADSVDLAAMLDRLYYDVDPSGTHWVRSPRYKASVGVEGLTYIPFLGSDAPKNAPVRFEFQSLEVDGEALPIGAATAASVTRTDDQVRVQRGPIEERFDFTKENVEQSFLLPEGLRGHVTITLRVIADEAYGNARIAGSTGASLWTSERGGVSYGEAFAVTEGGVKTNLQSRLADGSITIEVPASVTEVAAGRVLVDPIISTVTFGAPTLNDPISPYAAYDPTSGRYMGSVTTFASASDGDVFSFFVDPATGTVSGGAFSDMTAENWLYGLVGNHAFLGQFVTVARVEGVGIKTRFRLASDGTVYAPKLFAADTATFAVIPTDLGSDPYPSPAASFALAYIERYDLDEDFLVRTIDINGDPLSAPVALELFVPEFVSLGPRLSSTTGDPGLATQWTAAWITGSSSADRVVRAAVINFDGTISDGPDTVYGVPGSPAGFFLDASTPTALIDGTTGRQVTAIAFDTEATGGERAFHFLRCAGTNVLSEHDLGGLLQSGPGSTPRFAALADGWLLHSRDTGKPLRLGTVREIGGFPALAATPEDIDPQDAFSFDLVSAYEFGDPASEQALSLSTAGTPRALSGSIVEAASGTPAASQYCVAAPNSTGERGYLYALGDRSPLTPKTLVAERIPPFAAGIVIGGFEPARIPMLSGTNGTLCVNQGLGRFLDSLTAASAAGTSTYVLDPTAIVTATGPVPAISGGAHYFQFWFRDGMNANFTGAIAMRFE